MICVDNKTYEDVLTVGKAYLVRPSRAFWAHVQETDKGGKIGCYLKRFKEYNQSIEDQFNASAEV